MTEIAYTTRVEGQWAATTDLRWLNDFAYEGRSLTLQQRWTKIVFYPGEPEQYEEEWRDVPTVSAE